MVISDPELGFWPNGGWGNAISMLKALVRETEKTTVIARNLIAKPAASQAVAASRPAIVAAGRLRGLPCQPSSKAREQQACGQLTQSITATSGDP